MIVASIIQNSHFLLIGVRNDCCVPQTETERANLYLHCMVEIRERLSIVEQVLEWPLQALFVREFCYLQFRHVCEVFAIACLAAQGDFKTQKAFREAYKPADIFGALSDLYPSFFPISCIRTTGPEGFRITSTPESGAHKQADIIKLWAKSGDRLHRLNVAKYLKRSFKPEKPETDDIDNQLRGLRVLLEGHVIVLKHEGALRTLFHVEADPQDQSMHAHFLYLDISKGTMEVVHHQAWLEEPLIQRRR